MEDYQSAKVWLQKALNLAIENGDTKVAGNTYRNFGLVELKQQNYEEAINYFKKSIDFLRRSKDYNGIILTLDKIGLAHIGLENTEKAINNIQSALTLVEYIREKDQDYYKWLITADLARAYISCNQKNKAEKLLKEAHKNLKEIGHTHKAKTAKELLDSLNN